MWPPLTICQLCLFTFSRSDSHFFPTFSMESHNFYTETVKITEERKKSTPLRPVPSGTLTRVAVSDCRKNLPAKICSWDARYIAIDCTFSLLLGHWQELQFPIAGRICLEEAENLQLAGKKRKLIARYFALLLMLLSPYECKLAAMFFLKLGLAILVFMILFFFTRNWDFENWTFVQFL